MGQQPSGLRWANLPRLNTSTTEQAAAQTPAFPSGLHTITQTHHDEHNNYWAHMALCLHELSMSTQKATEAGITGWYNHGTKEWTPWDGGNLHPLTNLPTGIISVPPHSPISLGLQSLAAHTSLPVLQMLQVGTTGPAVPVDPIPPPREQPGHAAAPRRCPSPVGPAGSPSNPEKGPPRRGSPSPEGEGDAAHSSGVGTPRGEGGCPALTQPAELG